MSFFKQEEPIIIDDNSSQITVHYHNTEAARAIYNCKTNKGIKEVHLTWIETNSPYQGQGLGSKILTHLCLKIKNSADTLVIEAVDDEILTHFFLQWFKKHFDPEQNAKAKVIALFDQCLIYGDVYPTLKIPGKYLLENPLKREKPESHSPYCAF